jgi:hypothetical protein
VTSTAPGRAGIDKAALGAGAIRLASGISFLVDPVRANRMWGDNRR